MAGNLTLDGLRKAVKAGEIDTVLVAGVDMQGRLMGKRFHAQFFVDGGWEETHCCNYLLAVDMEMNDGSGLQVVELAKGLWRLCDEARHVDAAGDAVAAGDGAGAVRPA
jgi:hypothetical protein